MVRGAKRLEAAGSVWVRTLLSMVVAGILVTTLTGAAAWAQMGSTRLTVHLDTVLVIEPRAAAQPAPPRGPRDIELRIVPTGAGLTTEALRWIGTPGHVQARVEAGGLVVFESI